MVKHFTFRRVGDYGAGGFVMSNIAGTIPANPMSDRLQLLIEIHGESESEK